MEPGALLTLDIEKPVAGGLMLARCRGQVVLVDGTLPGETVRAQVTRVGRGVVYAHADDIVSASPHRRVPSVDRRCGGSTFGHVAYPHQLTLKAGIVQDALRRLGRISDAPLPDFIASPEAGYRMRARFHVREGHIGFFREGSHEICDAAATGQLGPATCAWLAGVQEEVGGVRGLTAVEMAENVSGSARACHLELLENGDPQQCLRVVAGGAVTGVSVSRRGHPFVGTLAGTPVVTDTLQVARAGVADTLRLRRDVRAFFQANRFLLEPLVGHVTRLVNDGPVIDLYAGVGLFGLALAVTGVDRVTMVEGDPVSGADLATNAADTGRHVRTVRQSVEEFLRESPSMTSGATIIVDPPRTGLSKLALAGVIRSRPAQLVYVSCDPATLGRDARTLGEAGFGLAALTGFDLFPNTAHVEVVAVFARG